MHHHLCILLFWIINRETKLNFMWAIKNWESNQWALKQTRPIVNKCHKHWLCKQWFRSVWYIAAGLPLVSENHTRRAASYTSTAEKNRKELSFYRTFYSLLPLHGKEILPGRLYVAMSFHRHWWLSIPSKTLFKRIRHLFSFVNAKIYQWMLTWVHCRQLSPQWQLH